MALLLDRSKLLAKEELQVVKVDLGKDEYVFVRQMTGRERGKYEQSLMIEKKDNKGVVTGFDQSLEDFRAKVAVYTLCDEKGKLLLKPEDVSVLSENMSAARLEKIAEEAQKINAITEQQKEVLLKNSEAVQDGNSSSVSAKN